MNDQELRSALHTVMAASPAPPSMNANTVLEVARRAQRRRRTMLAGLASAAAVVLITAGAIALPSLARDGGGSGQLGAGGAGTTEPSSTETSWPNGQTDRTAHQGPEADRAVRLMELLTTSLPATMSSPADLKPAPGAAWSGGLRMHQAQFTDRVDGKDIWEYQASIPVGGEGKWGRLLAQTISAGNQVPGDDACALSRQLWGMNSGNCVVITVGDKQVGVVSRFTEDETSQFDQWAGYRHPDGTVVFVAQAKTYFMTGLAGLTVLPFTSQELAALAVDPRFRLG